MFSTWAPQCATAQLHPIKQFALVIVWHVNISKVLERISARWARGILPMRLVNTSLAVFTMDLAFSQIEWKWDGSPASRCALRMNQHRLLPTPFISFFCFPFLLAKLRPYGLSRHQSAISENAISFDCFFSKRNFYLNTFRSFHQNQNAESVFIMFPVSFVLALACDIFCEFTISTFFVCHFRQAITLFAYEWIHPAMQQRNAIDNGTAGVMLMKMPCKIYMNKQK